ncbi:MAG: DNA replication/repair protein RecF [Sphingomonadaceae bacterium]
MITRLTLTNFRSYAAAAIDPSPGFVVLTGENGAGKTNILEAVSLLAPGRGLRGAALGAMASKDGSGGFAISAVLGDAQIGVGTAPYAPDKRIVRINGAAATATSLGEWLSILWLTPAQDGLFTDTPGQRRRFLDRLVLALDPGHAHHLARYEAAMRQRNLLMGQGSPDPEWLSALETAMAEHGAAIAGTRADVVVDLNVRIAQTPESAFARAALSLDGPIPHDLASDLKRNRTRDAAAGRALVGPHRQDLMVSHIAKQHPAAQSSTGEQKALLLGILLAHADLVADRCGRAPVLLLDEVAAHLDPVRRAALFARLATGGSQVWLTGTEASLFDAIPAGAARFTVADGRIA